MSLMLDSLKRIQARQKPAAEADAALQRRPVPVVQDASDAPPFKEPPACAAEVSLDEISLPESAALDDVMDQLEALVSQAGTDDRAFPAASANAPEEAFVVPPLGGIPPDDRRINKRTHLAPRDGRHLAERDEYVAAESDKDCLADPECGTTNTRVAPETGRADDRSGLATSASSPYISAARHILASLPQGHAQVILFTSPGDGYGKSTTVARLLPQLVEGLPGKILVVDANLRNPDMARWLAVAATWRLTDVLAGSTAWPEAVQPTSMPGVFILPGGTADGPERSVAGVARVLREASGRFDLVVVDASSLAHDGTAQLAAACDATYLVVRLGQCSARMVRDAVDVIQRSGGCLRGCIAIGG